MGLFSGQLIEVKFFQSASFPRAICARANLHSIRITRRLREKYRKRLVRFQRSYKFHVSSMSAGDMRQFKISCIGNMCSNKRHSRQYSDVHCHRNMIPVNANWRVCFRVAHKYKIPPAISKWQSKEIFSARNRAVGFFRPKLTIVPSSLSDLYTARLGKWERFVGSRSNFFHIENTNDG